MTIAEFLLARIAEDERAAGDTMPGTQFAGPDNMDYRAAQDNGIGYVWTSRTRVLAECEAKRRIVSAAWNLESHEFALPSTYAHIARQQSAIFRALAAPYRDHPDYDPEWAEE